MNKKEMQVVVDYVNTQADYLCEFIHDRSTTAEDRVRFKEELTALCHFLREAEAMEFDVSNGCYTLIKKEHLLEI